MEYTEINYLIISCDSENGFRFVETYETKEQAEAKMREYYTQAIKEKTEDNRKNIEWEVYGDETYIHISIDDGYGIPYNRWYEIVKQTK